MPDPDVRPGTSKDIVMREFVNDTIKIEMKNTQGHKKPGSKARLPPYQRKGYSHDVEPHRAHHDPEFLVVYMTAANPHEWPSEGVPNSILLSKPFAPAQLVTC